MSGVYPGFISMYPGGALRPGLISKYPDVDGVVVSTFEGLEKSISMRSFIGSKELFDDPCGLDEDNRGALEDLYLEFP